MCFPLLGGKTVAIRGTAESRMRHALRVMQEFVCACWERLGGGPGVLVAVMALILSRCIIEMGKLLSTTV